MIPDVRVLIMIPALDKVEADFALSLAGMCSQLAFPMKGCPPFSAALKRVRNSNIAASREYAATKALEGNFTHMLFVDSDQTFPEWTLHKLLSDRKSIVAANVSTKVVGNACPTARAYDPENRAGRLIYTTTKSSGLEQVWRIGTGIMLLETNLFRRIPQPWFEIRWNDKTKNYVGEDWGFCEKVEALGVPIFIDHDVSRLTGHVGSVVFHHGHVKLGEAFFEQLGTGDGTETTKGGDSPTECKRSPEFPETDPAGDIKPLAGIGNFPEHGGERSANTAS